MRGAFCYGYSWREAVTVPPPLAALNLSRIRLELALGELLVPHGSGRRGTGCSKLAEASVVEPAAPKAVWRRLGRALHRDRRLMEPGR